jgi:hypothetical protein
MRTGNGAVLTPLDLDGVCGSDPVAFDRREVTIIDGRPRERVIHKHWTTSDVWAFESWSDKREGDPVERSSAYGQVFATGGDAMSVIDELPGRPPTFMGDARMRKSQNCV